jgi:succinate dehydrogenase flavin-adding protein (antitoxin of CptAB toxin-antitoxin module)
MNTYIQDKLDTFEQFLMDKCPSHTNNSPEGFEKWLENLDIDELMDYAMNYRNQSLTDYHNHIVEEIEEYANSQTDKTVAMGIIGTVSLLKD